MTRQRSTTPANPDHPSDATTISHRDREPSAPRSPRGRLFLIPTSLQQPEEARPWLLDADRAEVARLTHFFVETPKTARRWLGQIGLDRPLQEVSIRALPKGDERLEASDWLAPLLAGEDAGLLSDAGCPGVADPGARLVAAAHAAGVEVRPLIGPSSILLGLMASGLDGQRFVFHGYLPTAADERRQTIERLAKRSASERETQMLIETPYRNQAMAEALIQHLPERTRLCLATDLTGNEQSIVTRTVAQWKKHPPTMPSKRPALFLFLA
ncbi:MAG: SAM-dependent methyltransferase [Lautropia sp.]|nr:SAM-dependent methyltransferase [Lautropia sp.]